MEAVITGITSIVTAGAGWLGTAATAISGNPIALTFVLLPLVGIGIGLFKRIIHLN